MRFHSGPPARCRRTSCASSSPPTSCPPRDAVDLAIDLRPSRLRLLFPGVMACAVVAAAAAFLGQHYGAPVLLFALLLGMAMNFLSDGGPCTAGIEFCARSLLR